MHSATAELACVAFAKHTTRKSRFVRTNYNLLSLRCGTALELRDGEHDHVFFKLQHQFYFHVLVRGRNRRSRSVVVCTHRTRDYRLHDDPDTTRNQLSSLVPTPEESSQRCQFIQPARFLNRLPAAQRFLEESGLRSRFARPARIAELVSS